MLSYRIPIKRILLNEYIVNIRNVVCKGYNYECWRESGLKGESNKVIPQWAGTQSLLTRTLVSSTRSRSRLHNRYMVCLKVKNRHVKMGISTFNRALNYKSLSESGVGLGLGLGLKG